jgi:hypothetical protein
MSAIGNIMDSRGYIFGLPRQLYVHESDIDFVDVRPFKGNGNPPAKWVEFNLSVRVEDNAVWFQYYGEDDRTIPDDCLKDILDDPIFYMNGEV